MVCIGAAGALTPIENSFFFIDFFVWKKNQKYEKNDCHDCAKTDHYYLVYDQFLIVICPNTLTNQIISMKYDTCFLLLIYYIQNRCVSKMHSSKYIINASTCELDIKLSSFFLCWPFFPKFYGHRKNYYYYYNFFIYLTIPYSIPFLIL